MGRWEWIILELLFLAMLVWELFSVRRSIRRAREEKAAALPKPGHSELPQKHE